MLGQLAGQAGAEFRIEPGEAFGVIEIGEGESVGEGKISHDGASMLTSAARSG
jgi:hypothetical protein